jgi:hypothetical protein
MKMRFPLIAALALAVTIVACNDMPVAPDVNFELVDETLRRATGNADVIATFSYTIPGKPGIRANEPGINSEGKEIGFCHEDGTGRWMNPSNRRWANAVPHSHCLNEGADEKIISLEKITSQFVSQEQGGPGNRFTVTDLFLSNSNDYFKVRWHGNSEQMTANGIVEAIAVDQHGNPFGKFVFNLADFSGTTNYFADYEATVEGAGVCVFGLSKTIDATYYAPDDDEGVNVPGTLYWETGEDCPEGE